MKIKSAVYAKTLIESAESDNLKQVAAGFWKTLQKNKQYKDLPKILDSIDQEAAKNENKILAKIYSKNEIDSQDKLILSEKLEKKLKQQVILKNIVNKNITGIVVKVDDKIIDLSVEGKLDRLKQILQ